MTRLVKSMLTMIIRFLTPIMLAAIPRRRERWPPKYPCKSWPTCTSSWVAGWKLSFREENIFHNRVESWGVLSGYTFFQIGHQLRNESLFLIHCATKRLYQSDPLKQAYHQSRSSKIKFLFRKIFIQTTRFRWLQLHRSEYLLSIQFPLFHRMKSYILFSNSPYTLLGNINWSTLSHCHFLLTSRATAIKTLDYFYFIY